MSFSSARTKRIKCVSGLTFFLGIGVFANSALASIIVVANPSFETNYDLVDEFDSGNNGWSRVDAATWSPVAGTYEFQQNEAEPTGHFLAAAHGVWSNLLTNSGKITQNLATIVNVGDTLSMTFSGGHSRLATANIGGDFSATFIVGAIPYSSTYDTSSQADDTWVTFTLTKTITNTGNLSISFEAVNDFPWLDNLSNVTVTPAPEPASAALLAMGFACLCRFRRKTRE